MQVVEQDDIAQAVLSRDEVVRYLQGNGGQSPDEAQAAIAGYLEELRTTQRYRMYRALQHPVYPILRKIERITESVRHVAAAARTGRVIYASNHKSHLDYVIEPIVLDDNDIRPPVIAAGINLFGGALGLIHKYVTGAIPIRRDTKDPAYLVTLKAYVAELLQRHDLFLYPEGGRTYSGERSSPSRRGCCTPPCSPGAAISSSCRRPSPTTWCWRTSSSPGSASSAASARSGRELAEMVRYAVGYQSRCFVSFGRPIEAGDFDPTARRDMVRLTRRVREAIGRLYKVVPTALVAAAIRPSVTRPELEDRIDQLIEILRSSGANLDVATGRAAVEAATGPLATRGIIVVEGDRYRVRQRAVLRYYSRTIDHLIRHRGGSLLTH